MLAARGKRRIPLKKALRNKLIGANEIFLASINGILIDPHDLISRHELSVYCAKVKVSQSVLDSIHVWFIRFVSLT